jgi:acyl carrier protein
VTRPDIIARIVTRVAYVTGAAPGEVAHDKPLKGQQLAAGTIDSLDLTEIEIAVEEAFDLPMSALDLQPDASVESIADAVIAAKGSAA